MMAGDDLRQLEREVETARAKLSADIAALRSPGVFSEFAQNLKQTALETRDTFIDDATSRTRSAVEDMVETVKEKAVANPTAALVIGAGIAWHLIRRPPVAAALIGGGIFSLLRTDAAPRSPNGKANPLMRTQENLKQQAQDLAGTAGEMSRQGADAARDRIGELAEAAEEKAAEVSAAAKHKISGLRDTAADKVSGLARSAKEAISRAPLVGEGANAGALDARSHYGLPGEHPEDAYVDARDRYRSAAAADKLLLGVAGIAVAAAVAAIYRRGRSQLTD